MKKGRHRRFEEARSLKRAIEVTAEPCPECGADPEDEHASWCLYEAEEPDEPDSPDEPDPLGWNGARDAAHVPSSGSNGLS